MEATDTNRHGIRFTRDFEFYDHSGSNMWRSWSAGDVVNDPRDIEWLTSIGAPIEIKPETKERT
jgi:hypothetical protein